MWKEDSISMNDFDSTAKSFEKTIKKLENSTVFVTGATGLIGSNIIKTLLYCNDSLNTNIHIIALIRNEKKAETVFAQQLAENVDLKFVIGDVNNLPEIADNIDYIIHGASVTASKDFVQKPVETINTAFKGTECILRLATDKKIKSMVYLSTMEVYGNNTEDIRLTEDSIGYLNPIETRSSYPESKKMCECMCSAYANEYKLPVKILRLTQTFGMGVAYDDGRVFAEFARCVIENRDIVLHTKGETKRSYLYTADAVSAILCVLVNGENGQAYHAANENTFCSIYEMANMVAGLSKDKISVHIEVDEVNRGYAPTILINLDTSKLNNIGWKAYTSLPDMYKRMIEYMKMERKDER